MIFYILFAEYFSSDDILYFITRKIYLFIYIKYIYFIFSSDDILYFIHWIFF